MQGQGCSRAFARLLGLHCPSHQVWRALIHASAPRPRCGQNCSGALDIKRGRRCSECRITIPSRSQGRVARQTGELRNRYQQALRARNLETPRILVETTRPTMSMREEWGRRRLTQATGRENASRHKRTPVIDGPGRGPLQWTWRMLARSATRRETLEAAASVLASLCPLWHGRQM